jgi:hypothetical protein
MIRDSEFRNLEFAITTQTATWCFNNHVETSGTAIRIGAFPDGSGWPGSGSVWGLACEACDIALDLIGSRLGYFYGIYHQGHAPSPFSPKREGAYPGSPTWLH